LFQADAKTKLFVYEWLPDQKVKAVMIGIHGGMAHSEDWVTPALYFKQKSFATYAPDLRWRRTVFSNDKMPNQGYCSGNSPRTGNP